MNKAQLINAIAARSGLTRKDSDLAANAAFKIITEALAAGDRVQIVGFGCFDVRERPARKGRNPMTGEAIDIGETRSVTFKPGKSMKDAMEVKIEK